MNTDVWTSLRRYKPDRRSQPLQRRPDAQLHFIETTGIPSKLLYDTTVYIDTLRGKFPGAGRFILRTVEAWHSPVAEAELAVLVGSLDPAHPNTRTTIDEIAISISHRALHRTIIPDVTTWREAGILSGILARLQGYDKSQRRRLLNDALLFVTARRHGCTVLTRNIGDFDFLQQLDPAGRVLFYRT
ncbi:MAG TPA: type II toxin-antitoxin system VapC family toxin [Candidatus Sulfotelmatobacter sp.]